MLNKIIFKLKMDAFQNNYLNQAGSGFVAFQGVRVQKGHRFFGRFFQGMLPNILQIFRERDFKYGTKYSE